jgi:hypothetical protein
LAEAMKIYGVSPDFKHGGDAGCTADFEKGVVAFGNDFEI